MNELDIELAHGGHHLGLIVVGGAALTITASVYGGPDYMANDIDVRAEPPALFKSTKVARGGLLNDKAIEADTTTGLREVVGRARRVGALWQWISFPNLEVEVLGCKILWATLLMGLRRPNGNDKLATLEWLAGFAFSSPAQAVDYVRDLYRDVAGVPSAKLGLVTRTIPRYFS
jgi:hypothetical protein